MKKSPDTELARLAWKNAKMSLRFLIYTLLELAYQAGRALTKGVLMAVIRAIKTAVFVFSLPFSVWKCTARTVRQRSFTAGAQLAKWIWIDYWKTKRK